MTLHRIRLELARSHDFPEGSPHHGYEFVLPLGADGKIDMEAWPDARQLCTVHRFWTGEDDLTGTLIHSHNRWSFSYKSGEIHEEPIPHFQDHLFREGEYLAVREQDEKTYTFKIVSVTPLTIAPI